MSKKILVDASYKEDIRVALLDSNTLEDIDFENTAKKQYKGNIYLGKITRVEPSLQSVFVEYGFDKQGFLPFSEIHYDYFQIPVEDKENLAKAIEAEIALSTRKNESSEENDDSNRKQEGKKWESEDDSVKRAEELALAFAREEGYIAENASQSTSKDAKEEKQEEQQVSYYNASSEDVDIKQITANFYSKYKINEVLKRNQIILVQVNKEERGNKGSALTTYISLAGRYCVYMPNTSGSGGVSKRIDSWQERKRLKDILKNISVEQKGSLILRTASIGCEQNHIESDFIFLKKLWAKITEKTISSTAPSLIYEESNIVIRSIRDMYSNQLEQILVEGQEAYKSVKEFIDALDPENSSKVIKYSGEKPIFNQYKIDRQIDGLFENQVHLPSGGSIVIQQTEALISIDVNSGKATRERSIEETAYRTNLEAAREVARQLRLRDLSGLVVIDFIDMREIRNRKNVENELRELLKKDRASTQVGRISMFGLLEMSRQRLKNSFFESSSIVCPHCKGSGFIRSHMVASVWVLREIESRISSGSIKEIRVTLNMDIAHFILNKLREKVIGLEKKYQADVFIIGSNRMLVGNCEFNVVKRKEDGKSLENQTDEVSISDLYQEQPAIQKQPVENLPLSNSNDEEENFNKPSLNSGQNPNFNRNKNQKFRHGGGDRKRFDNKRNSGSFRNNNQNNGNNEKSFGEKNFQKPFFEQENTKPSEDFASKNSSFEAISKNKEPNQEKSKLMGLWKKFTG
jgi:ribonuclease E